MASPRKKSATKPVRRRRPAVELRTRDELLAALAASEARTLARLDAVDGRVAVVEVALLGNLDGKVGILPRLASLERRVRQLVAILLALPATAIAAIEFIRSLFRSSS